MREGGYFYANNCFNTTYNLYEMKELENDSLPNHLSKIMKYHEKLHLGTAGYGNNQLDGIRCVKQSTFK